MAGDKRPTLLLTTDTVGGVWTYAVDLARTLARRGIDVHLATMGAPLRSHQRLQVSGCRGLTLHTSDWRLEWMADAWHDVDLAGRWLLALERKVRPDVVHLNQFAFGALPFRAPKLVVAHSCVLSWWRAVHGAEAPDSWNRYREETGAGLAAIDTVIAPTQAILRELERDHDLPPGRTAVVHNGTPPPPVGGEEKEALI